METSAQIPQIMIRDRSVNWNDQPMIKLPKDAVKPV